MSSIDKLAVLAQMTTYDNVVKFIVRWCATNSEPFTVVDIVHNLEKEVGRLFKRRRKECRNAVSNKLAALCRLGCLTHTAQPAPHPNLYNITAAALDILVTDVSDDEKAAGLLKKFNVPVPRRSRKEKNFAVKNAAKNNPPQQPQDSGTVTCTLPNGVRIEGDCTQVEKLIEKFYPTMAAPPAKLAGPQFVGVKSTH